MVARKVLAQGLGRAGADVAEHDADRADGQLQLAIALMPMAVMAGVGGGFEGSCGAPARLLRLSSHRAPLDEPAPLEQVSIRPAPGRRVGPGFARTFRRHPPPPRLPPTRHPPFHLAPPGPYAVARADTTRPHRPR